MSDRDEVFTIPARRCKRCGGLLTSAKGIRDGYGPCCLRKIRQEEADREMMKYQCSLFDARSMPQDGAESPPLGEAYKEPVYPLNGSCVAGKSPTGQCSAAAYCEEPYNCCLACPKDCNIRCGWAKDEGSN